MAGKLLERLYVLFQGRTDERSFGDAEKRIKRFRSTVSNVGKGLSAIGAAGTAAATGILFAAKNFEQARNSLRSVIPQSKVTEESFQSLVDRAKGLGASTKFSAKEVLEAMEAMARKGLSTQEVLGGIEGVLNLSAAGQISLAEAAEGGVGAVKAFGLEMKDLPGVVDQLAKASTSSGSTVAELLYTVGRVGSVAHSADLDISQMAAAFGKLRDVNVSAETAAISIRQALLRLVNPTKGAREELEKLGINTETLSTRIQSGGLVGILQELKTAGVDLKGVGVIFGAEAAAGVGSLIEQAPGVKALTAEIRDSRGASEEMRETLMEGLPGAIAEITSAWEGMMISLSESGFSDMLVVAIKEATGLIRAFTDAPPVIKKMGGALALLSPVLLGVGAGVALLTSPISLVAIAVIAVVTIIAAAVTAIIHYWDDIKEAFRAGMRWLTDSMAGKGFRWVAKNLFNVDVEGLPSFEDTSPKPKPDSEESSTETSKPKAGLLGGGFADLTRLIPGVGGPAVAGVPADGGWQWGQAAPTQRTNTVNVGEVKVNTDDNPRAVAEGVSKGLQAAAESLTDSVDGPERS